MTLFRDRYRIESARLPGWNYAGSGCYFVTICTRDRVCCLGDVVDGTIRLTAAGEIVAEEWLRTEYLRHNVVLDEWVVMPNHFHGIVWIRDDKNMNESRGDAPVGRLESVGRLVKPVATRDVPPARLYKSTLGSIVGQFKSVCTKRILAAGHPFAWQPRFHDQIIRDEKTLVAVRTYIRENPVQWASDREYCMR